jgi:hypothetical protein
MKIVIWPCMCPVCRTAFSAYLADCINPQRDEVAHDKRSLLCNVCEQAFVAALFHALREEGVDSRGLALSRLSLSALRKEAQRAGESGKEATIGTGEPGSLFSGVHGLHDKGCDTDVSHGVPGVLDSPNETLRGSTVLPADTPE